MPVDVLHSNTGDFEDRWCKYCALLRFVDRTAGRNRTSINTRRNFFSKITAMAALLPGLKLFAQQVGTSSTIASKDEPRRMGAADITR
jgi:hypothetical protein